MTEPSRFDLAVLAVITVNRNGVTAEQIAQEVNTAFVQAGADEHVNAAGIRRHAGLLASCGFIHIEPRKRAAVYTATSQGRQAAREFVALVKK